MFICYFNKVSIQTMRTIFYQHYKKTNTDKYFITIPQKNSNVVWTFHISLLKVFSNYERLRMTIIKYIIKPAFYSRATHQHCCRVSFRFLFLQITWMFVIYGQNETVRMSVRNTGESAEMKFEMNRWVLKKWFWSSRM